MFSINKIKLLESLEEMMKISKCAFNRLENVDIKASLEGSIETIKIIKKKVERGDFD